MGDIYRQRMMEIVEELRAQRVNRYTTAPPLFRILWRLGYHVAPPFYQSFMWLAVVSGTFFAAGMLLVPTAEILVIYEFSLPLRPLTTQFLLDLAAFSVVGCLASGIIFGLLMAFYFRWKARKVQLPPLGLCLKCGYDLRASKDRCPECGTAITTEVKT